MASNIPTGFYKQSSPAIAYKRKLEKLGESSEKRMKTINGSFSANDSLSDTSTDDISGNRILSTIENTPGKTTSGSKAQRKVLRKITNFSEQLRDEVRQRLIDQDQLINAMQEEIQTMRAELNEFRNTQVNQNNKVVEKIPNELSSKVHDIYKTFEGDNLWTFVNNIRFDNQVNTPVTQKIISTVLDSTDEYNAKIIRAACGRYFSHLKRTVMDITTMSPTKYSEREKSRRQSSRRSRLFMRRKKKVVNAGLSDIEKSIWNLSTLECMTDEETDDDDPNAFVIHKLPWRSDTLDNIIIKIDQVQTNNGGNAHKVRKIGDFSSRNPSSSIAKELVI